MKLTLSKDKVLFTPGPLTTSRTVKQAMLRDMGSRDAEFLAITQAVRAKLLLVAGLGADYTAVLMQGSGTFAVESVITSVVPRQGKLLVVANGAYGARIAQIAEYAGVQKLVLSYAEDQKPDPREIKAALQKDAAITHVAVVHCETTSGVFNPIEAIGELAQQFGKTYIVDAMSSFGAVPIRCAEIGIDYLISSANKCIEGVPGLGFVLARRHELERAEGCARSLSLDLHAQWKALETSGEFRFTPPIQALLALDQALDELQAEGGVLARAMRYRESHEVLVEGMRELGFEEYLRPADQGYIITSFRYLSHPRFEYRDFYGRIQQRGYVIYSGKVTNAECFRIGNIGRIDKHDVLALLGAIREVLAEMGVRS